MRKFYHAPLRRNLVSGLRTFDRGSTPVDGRKYGAVEQVLIVSSFPITEACISC